MNSITELLNLEDSDIRVSDISIVGKKKYLTLETLPAAHFCPICGFKMHSKGIKKRTINHPVLQDTYELILILKQRRWKCTNNECKYELNESFRFVNKRRRCTNVTDMLIINEFKDLSMTAVSVARKFNISDSQAISVFDRYVKLGRLKLTDIISIDEVFIDMGADCKYALVIQDFHTGEPIDFLRSRLNKITEPYFTSIPIEERCNVKYLISDMYNPYIRYVDKYFPNAVAVVDSFHVIQWIVRSIDSYIRKLIKHYKQRDKEIAESKRVDYYEDIKVPLSDEVYLLQKYRWLILANQANIHYRTDLRMDSHFHCMMNTYDYEFDLFRIDPRLETLRNLKEMYIMFNNRNAGNPVEARIELDALIENYLYCGDSIFYDFANLLIKNHDYIINSFIMAEKYGSGKIYSSRLSNGPIESINRKVKDLKRMGRGFRNFEHLRNRFLYATRNNPVLIGSSNINTVQYYDED